MLKLQMSFKLPKTTNDFVAKFKSANIRGASIEKVSENMVVIDSDDQKTYSLVKQFIANKTNWKSPESKVKLPQQSSPTINNETPKLNAKSQG